MTHTHLSFNVCKLGEHERPVEGQLCHIVVIQARTEGLEKEDTHTHTVIIDKLLWYEQKKKTFRMSCCGKNNLLQGCNSSCDFQWTMSYNPNTDYFPITAYPGVFNSLIIIYYLGPSGSVTVIACKSRELFCLTPPPK